MASSGNFAVFSYPTRPESPYSSSDQIIGGGLSVKGPSSGSFEPVIATISPNSGKWYWEYRAGQGGGSSYGRPAIAVSEQGVVKNEDFIGGGSGQTGVLFTVNNGNKRINGSETSYGNAVSQHDIVQIALDCDNGAVYLGINNTWQNSGDPTSGSSKTGAALTSGIQNVNIDIIHTRYYGGGIDQYNFGQDDTFGGAITGAGNQDENGHGVFKYTPPTGFLALCSANLPISDDIDPAQTDDDYPQKNFNVVTFSGNGSTNAVTGLGFKPDLIWGFTRDGSQSKRVVDSTRGGSSALFSDTTAAAGTQTVISEFGSDGFTANGGYFNNDSGRECGAWCWRANGGTTSSNSSGGITSTVQANQAAGFSIITYSGNGSSGATIGHGLSSKPEWIIVKNLTDSDGTSHWTLYHVVPGATEYTTFTASAFTANSGFWNNTEPTSTLITLGNNNRVNGSGKNYVCYAWHGVEGYSKFSSFIGNGNADGPFIYTGFRPRFIFIKKDATTSWHVFDTARNTFNPVNTYQLWDTSGTDDTASSNSIDFLSNGFKLRNNATGLNASGSTYYYGAWGDVPFKYNNTF